MNRSGSHRNHENRFLYDGPPPQGLSLGTAGQDGFLHFSFKSLIRRTGSPFGGGGFIVIGGVGVSTPIIILEECDFHGKPSKKEGGQGGAPLGLPPPLGERGGHLPDSR